MCDKHYLIYAIIYNIILNIISYPYKECYYRVGHLYDFLAGQ